MHRESIYGAFVARQRIGVTVFTLEPDAMVITSTYVTQDRLSILEVTHQYDEDEGHCWQFHCGNGDYSMEKMQMVRLSTILKIDPRSNSPLICPWTTLQHDLAPKRPGCMRLNSNTHYAKQRPNHSIEGMSSRLRRQATPHVKR
jgi:hypothetical protein